MIANGHGKGRARQDGSRRHAKSWRTLLLSTGEKSIAEKIAEDGGRIQAGQEVRLADIPADAGAGLGLFENLHGHDSARAFADAIKRQAATNYGHLSREFIKAFLAHPEAKKTIRTFLAEGMPLLSDSSDPSAFDGQVQRVGRRFLLVAAAEWGLLPWQKGEALQAAKTCFEAWLGHRGGTGAHKDKAALEQVTLFLEQHGQSRFQDLERPDMQCINRAGFRERTEQGTTYYILPESFKAEVCKGISAQRTAKLLAEKGILQKGDGKNMTRRPPRDLPDFGASVFTFCISAERSNKPCGLTTFLNLVRLPKTCRKSRTRSEKRLFQSRTM